MSVLAPLLDASRARLRHDARVTPLRDLRRQVGDHARRPRASRPPCAMRRGLRSIAEVKRSSPSAGTFASVADRPIADLARSLCRCRRRSHLRPDRADPVRRHRRRPSGRHSGSAAGAAQGLHGRPVPGLAGASAGRGRRAAHRAGPVGRRAPRRSGRVAVRRGSTRSSRSTPRPSSSVPCGWMPPSSGSMRATSTASTVDRDATLDLIAAARAAGATVVAESGLSEPAHLAAVAAAGAHAALIGTALLAANDPAGAPCGAGIHACAERSRASRRIRRGPW